MIVSVETVHGRFQFINAPEEEPTMVARLPQQVLLLLVLGEWNTISIPVFYIYIYIFRLGPRPSSILERATKNILGRSFARGRDASRCYLLDRGGGGGFSLIRGRLEDSSERSRLGRNEWHRANSNIPISIAERWNYEFNYRRNSGGMGGCAAC